MYATFNYYKSTYGGSLTESSFAKYEKRAELLIDDMTNLAAQTAPDSMEDKLAYATCAVADTLYQADNLLESTQNGAVASENNDGYSIAYNNDKTSVAAQNKAIFDICSMYLTSPYNLMYTGRWPYGY